jgi:predicted nucleotidyltransferase
MADIMSIMDVAKPYSALVPTLDGTVLTVLAGTRRPLTGREVARLAGRRGHSGVLIVLNRLTEHGLVDRVEAGRALLYTLNREHLVAPAVELLAGIRAELRRRIVQTLEEWETAPLHVSMFGSAARGDGDTGSDIDLFTVRPESVSADAEQWRTQLDDLATDIRRLTGNHASIADVGKDELRELQRAKRPILGELRKDAVTLFGPTVDDLLLVSL